MPPKWIECSSRLVTAISRQFGVLRVDAESSYFPESLPNKGSSWYGFVCILSIRSDTNLRCLETRSSQSCNRCISTELGTQIPVCFSPILHDSKCSQQNAQGKSSKVGINNPSLDNTSLLSKDFEHINKSPILLPWRKDLLKNPKGEIHPLAQNRTLQLAACAISGLDCRRREFQRQLPTLSPGQEDQILIQIISRSGESGLAGVLEGKLIHFLVI